MKPIPICIGLLLTLSQAANAAEFEQLDWLTGHWAASDGAYEEVWLAPRQGSMVGSFRWIFPDGRQVLEFLVVEESDAGVVLRFKHFDTSYESWEKQEPNTYRLEKLTDTSVSFIRTTKKDSVPYRMTYTRTGDILTFTAEGTEADKRDPLVLEFSKQ